MPELDTRPTNDKVRRRDRAVDVVRLTALVIVMFGHCALLLATIDSGGMRIGNPLGAVPAIAPVTWAVQVMPLFFLAGGAAGAYGWHAGTPWGVWLFARAQRLCRPVYWYLAAWAVGLFVVRLFLGAESADALGRESVSLLWFLGVYLIALAVVPALTRLEQVSNTSPPTLLLGLHCMWMSCTFVVVAGHLRRWTALGGFLLAAVAARVCAGWR